MAKLSVARSLSPQVTVLFSEGGLWGKIKQLGAEVQGLIEQLTGSGQPERIPIPVRVEK